MKRKIIWMTGCLAVLALLTAGCSQKGSEGAGSSSLPVQSTAGQSSTANDPDALASEAAGWMIEGDYQKALDCYTRALALDGTRADLYAFRADAYVALGDLESARNDFLMASDLYTQQGEMELAQLTARQAEDPAAEVEYEPDDSQAQEQPEQERLPDLYYANSGVLKTHYVYDDAGVLREQIDYHENGKEDTHTYFEYDEAGNMVRESIYIRQDTLLLVYEYEYDSAGQLTARETFEGGTTLKSRWEYGPDGNLAKEIEYNSDGSVRCELEH